MVDIFNLWSLYQHPDRQLSFDVTQANMPELARGSKELMDACLRAFGLASGARSWRITPFRSHFYTDYGDSDDWTDRWQIGWQVDVVPSSPPRDRRNTFVSLPRRVDVTDETWDDDDEDPRHNNTALLVTVQEDAPSAVETFARELCDKLGRGAPPHESTVQIRSYGARIQQLRITLTGDLFPDIVPCLDDLVTSCKKKGVAFNWREVPD